MISRLHIGDSFITHSFLMKGEEPPVCIVCDERLTIKHILLTCSDFTDTRESCFTSQSLHFLFQDISWEDFSLSERNQLLFLAKYKLSDHF